MRHQVAAGLAFCALLSATSAPAQQLNKNKTLTGQADAKIAMAQAQAALVGEQRDGQGLQAQKLTDRAISTDCGPVQIGGQTTGQAARPKSLTGSNLTVNSQATVTKDVVVVCKR